MSDNMQSTDEILDDESPDAKATEAYEEVEEFDPFEGMSDEELDERIDSIKKTDLCSIVVHVGVPRRAPQGPWR